MTTREFLNSKYTTEDQMTILCWYWIKDAYPQTKGLFFHVPNELPTIYGESPKNYVKRLAKRTAMGVVSGIPDFLSMSPLFGIELKNIKGAVSPAQKEIHSIWTQHNIPVHVCKSLHEFYNIIVNYYGTPKS